MSFAPHRHAAQDERQAPATQGHVIRWAGSYDALTDFLLLGRRARIRRATVELAGVQPGAAVLEVGCGTGDVALAAGRLAGSTGTVYGIDPSPEMIAVAREKAARAASAVTFQLGLIEALSFSDGAFDVVLSSLMMHHLPGELKRQGLSEIARVLKPGGRLLIVDIKRPTARLGRAMLTVGMHGRLTTGVQDLAPLLSATGFVDVEVGDVGFPLLGFVRGRRA